jgi:hypothetical protein
VVTIPIEEKLGKKIICECEPINDTAADKRAWLQRSFGVDLGKVGCDTTMKNKNNL